MQFDSGPSAAQKGPYEDAASFWSGACDGAFAIQKTLSDRLTGVFALLVADIADALWQDAVFRVVPGGLGADGFCVWGVRVLQGDRDDQLCAFYGPAAEDAARRCVQRLNMASGPDKKYWKEFAQKKELKEQLIAKDKELADARAAETALRADFQKAADIEKAKLDWASLRAKAAENKYDRLSLAYTEMARETGKIREALEEARTKVRETLAAHRRDLHAALFANGPWPSGAEQIERARLHTEIDAARMEAAKARSALVEIRLRAEKATGVSSPESK